MRIILALCRDISCSHLFVRETVNCLTVVDKTLSMTISNLVTVTNLLPSLDIELVEFSGGNLNSSYISVKAVILHGTQITIIRKVGRFLQFHILAASQVISGWVPT